MSDNDLVEIGAALSWGKRAALFMQVVKIKRLLLWYFKV
jgi:hypothetical protein